MPNIDIIKDELTEAQEIKEIVNYFKQNHRSFFNEYIIKKDNNSYSIEAKNERFQIVPPNTKTKEFIENNLSDNLIVLPVSFSEFNKEDGIIKGDELQSKIIELVNVHEHKDILLDILDLKSKHTFLSEISELRLNAEKEYNADDYEYKLLEVACAIDNESTCQDFRQKIIIETKDKDLRLYDIPPFTDKIKINDFELSVAKILPDDYENCDQLSKLINRFISLGLNRDKLENLLGVSAEPDIRDVFNLLSKNEDDLENAEQLAFVILYNKFEENIDLKKFKVLTKGGESYDLTFNFYTKHHGFLVDGAALNDRYNGIKEILKVLPFDISDNNQILQEPYFIDEKFICPDLISENLNEEQKLDLIEFVYKKWNKKSKKTDFKNIYWGKINNTDTIKILGFNPTNSVYPSKYACQSEELPDYLLKWINKEDTKIDFLSDLGVWTENSVIVELRKYLSGKIKDFNNNRLAQESRFNENELNLFNSFVWLKEKELTLKSAEQFETFKKAKDVINQNRGSKGDLEIVEEFNFEKLEQNSANWAESYYENWKEESDINIFLYDGELPKTISLDEVENYIFYSFNEGNVAVKEEINIYINQNTDIKKELIKLELENNNFNFNGLWQNKLEILEKDNELLRKSKEIPKEENTNSSFLDEINKFISELEETEWNDYVPELKNLLELSVYHRKEKQKLFNLIAKIKLTKELNTKFEDSDESFNAVKIGINNYFVHSARGAFAYIHPLEILKMKEEGYKMALDFNTKSRIKIYETAEEILSLNTNHILAFQHEKTMDELFAFCEANKEANKHLLIIDKDNSSEKARTFLKLLNIEDDYQ